MTHLQAWRRGKAEADVVRALNDACVEQLMASQEMLEVAEATHSRTVPKGQTLLRCFSKVQHQTIAARKYRHARDLVQRYYALERELESEPG